MIRKIMKYALLLFVVILLIRVFLPVSYNVPALQKRTGTKFWNLSTGSRIGYTRIEAKGIKKPFPIVYLHGGPGGHITARDINALSPLANDGFDVYLYDQEGSGFSARLGNIKDYTVARHIRDLEEILKNTGSAKAILVGQSWGAILAVLFTAKNPGKVEKIIFTCPGPVFPVRRELANLEPPDSFHLRAPFYSNQQGNDKAGNLRAKVMAWCARLLNIKFAPDKEADQFFTYQSSEVNRSTVCDTSKVPGAEGGGGFYAAIMTFKDLRHVEDPRPQLRNSNIPVLVMKGECDNQKWGFTNEYLQLFPSHQLVIIPGAGHFISLEQPELYTEAIRGFVNK